MTKLELASFALNLIDLILTAVGAFVAAKAVTIDSMQAELGSGWDGTDTVKRALLTQNASA
jgi:hypothetical protein